MGTRAPFFIVWFRSFHISPPSRAVCLGLALVVGPWAEDSARASGFVTGFGQFNKIADNPSAGRQQLYEWDLFLSPPGEGYVGQPRRLGAPPGQSPTYDGYYRINGVPPGVYSLYVSQPDFFASPKVIPNVVVRDGVGTFANVDLDVDYSTYFSAGNEWTAWDDKYYQTFVAQGIGVRGVSWRMAGAGLYDGKTANVGILEDNGLPNPANWNLVASGSDSNLAADSDEWVRFRYGQAPLTPGKRYAVSVGVPGGMAVYKRNKDADSYQAGQAHDENGAPKNFDLNLTVFVDTEEAIVTHTRRRSGPGVFHDDYFDQRWGQTFVAKGTSLAAVDLFAASSPGFNIQWQVREGGPQGAVIGPTKTVGSAYFATTTALAGVSYNPGEIPLAAGQTYYIEAYNPSGFNPYAIEPAHAFSDGTAYRRGNAVSGQDLSMTIMEYLRPQAACETIAFTNFDEPASGSTSFTPGVGDEEMGFNTTSTPLGSQANVLVGKTVDPATPSSPVFSHRTVAATTTFATVDLVGWKEVTASVMVNVRSTTYEADDLLKIYLTSGDERIDLLSLAGGAPLGTRAGDGYLFYTADVPAAWRQATLAIESQSNSSAGAERFDFDNVRFAGYPVPEPAALTLAFSAVAPLGAWLFARRRSIYSTRSAASSGPASAATYGKCR